jgi:hypothetical protein
LVVLDPERIIPDDPGADTPVMVFLNPVGAITNPSGCKASATYWCAIGEGEIEGYKLSESELQFLDRLEDKVEALFEEVDCGA